MPGGHAVSSGFFGSPNPSRCHISAARAAAKGDYFRTLVFFPRQLYNLACRNLIECWGIISRLECVHRRTLNCNITPNISSILQGPFYGGRTEAARQYARWPVMPGLPLRSLSSVLLEHKKLLLREHTGLVLSVTAWCKHRAVSCWHCACITKHLPVRAMANLPSIKGDWA